MSRRSLLCSHISVCQVDTDVVFVLDSSGSIGSSNYQTVRDYTYNYTEGLFSGDTNSRVAVILYSDSANVEIPFDFGSTYGGDLLLEEISRLQYISGYTNTPEGLCLLKTMPWRTSVSVLRLAIVLTDGMSNRFSTNCSTPDGGPGTVNSTSREVHDLEPPVTVLAIGVDNYVVEELNAIATSPELVDELDSFDYRLLLQNQRSRTYFICFQGTYIKLSHIANSIYCILEFQMVAPDTNLQRGEIGMGVTSRLEFPGSRDTGVSVRICVDRGVVIVYGSYTSPNPNAAMHDFSEILRAVNGVVTPASCLTSYATINDVGGQEDDLCNECISNLLPERRKRQANEEERERDVVIYITIEGASDALNQFTVESEIGGAFGKKELTCFDTVVDSLHHSAQNVQSPSVVRMQLWFV